MGDTPMRLKPRNKRTSSALQWTKIKIDAQHYTIATGIMYYVSAENQSDPAKSKTHAWC
jgi:hypothetical protein